MQFQKNLAHVHTEAIIETSVITKFNYYRARANEGFIVQHA